MDGVLIVDKPKGMTSHDVVDFIRRRFRIRKAGHAGSLDPIATGVLVLLLGRATKLSARLVNDDKVYEGTMKCGVATDTMDAEGKVTDKKDCSGLDEEKIKSAFSKFIGEQYQEPPSFSALKHKGTPLYKLARRGISVEKEPRKIYIKELSITGIKSPFVSFAVRCSKGTYIRKLCHDIGRELGCGAHMTALRRIAAGEYDLKDSVSLEELGQMDTEQLSSKLSNLLPKFKNMSSREGT